MNDIPQFLILAAETTAQTAQMGWPEAMANIACMLAVAVIGWRLFQ